VFGNCSCHGRELPPNDCSSACAREAQLRRSVFWKHLLIATVERWWQLHPFQLTSVTPSCPRSTPNSSWLPTKSSPVGPVGIFLCENLEFCIFCSDANSSLVLGTALNPAWPNDWVIDWLMDGWIYWLIRSIDWSIWLIDLIARLVGWLVDWFIDFFIQIEKIFDCVIVFGFSAGFFFHSVICFLFFFANVLSQTIWNGIICKLFNTAVSSVVRIRHLTYFAGHFARLPSTEDHHGVLERPPLQTGDTGVVDKLLANSDDWGRYPTTQLQGPHGLLEHGFRQPVEMVWPKRTGPRYRPGQLQSRTNPKPNS